MTMRVSPDEQYKDGPGEIVARFGEVYCHQFLSPPKGTPYGLLRHPKDSGSALAAMVNGEDPDAHADRWWAQLAEELDRATAWAYRQGFAWASDEPLEATEAGQDSPYVTWALVPAESVAEVG